MNRGALIVLEGIDRTGKSTQCKTLVSSLQNKQLQVEYANFPNRSSETGKIINNYLTSQNDLPDEAIHLLFSANRWEASKSLIKKLESGINVVVDRYCYSGVAFSAAKGLDIDWCKSPDAGLPKPDKVFFLTMPIDVVQQRNGFGKERYEKFEFQKKVSEMYEKLKDENWEVLDASRTIEVIQEELLNKTLEVIKSVKLKPIRKIWE